MLESRMRNIEKIIPDIAINNSTNGRKTEEFIKANNGIEMYAKKVEENITHVIEEK